MSGIPHLIYAKIFKGEGRELILTLLANCLLRGLLLKKEIPPIKPLLPMGMLPAHPNLLTLEHEPSCDPWLWHATGEIHFL